MQTESSPNEVQTLELLVVEQSAGRARNGRGWFITACALLVVSLVAGVAIRGWSHATNVADSRGESVQVLTEAYQHLAGDTVTNAKIDRCQDRAFSAWIDDAIVVGEAKEGVLSLYYATCERTDGKSFR